MAEKKQSTKRPAELLTQDEVTALLGAFSTTGSAGIRDRAMYALIYRCGLRIGEALALLPKDVDAKGQTVRVLHGKGDKARTVGIDTQTLAFLEVWLNRRAKLGLNKKGAPLFCGIREGQAGKEISQITARESLHRAADRAGIEKRVHPHGLRHVNAVELVREGFNVHQIKQHLGHSSLATTDIYLSRLMPQDTVTAVAKREWKA